MIPISTLISPFDKVPVNEMNISSSSNQVVASNRKRSREETASGNKVPIPSFPLNGTSSMEALSPSTLKNKLVSKEQSASSGQFFEWSITKQSKPKSCKFELTNSQNKTLLTLWIKNSKLSASDYIRQIAEEMGMPVKVCRQKLRCLRRELFDLSEKGAQNKLKGFELDSATIGAIIKEIGMSDSHKEIASKRQKPNLPSSTTMANDLAPRLDSFIQPQPFIYQMPPVCFPQTFAPQPIQQIQPPLIPPAPTPQPFIYQMPAVCFPQTFMPQSIQQIQPPLFTQAPTPQHNIHQMLPAYFPQTFVPQPIQQMPPNYFPQTFVPQPVQQMQPTLLPQAPTPQWGEALSQQHNLVAKADMTSISSPSSPLAFFGKPQQSNLNSDRDEAAKTLAALSTGIENLNPRK